MVVQWNPTGLDTKLCPVGLTLLTLTELEATTCLWLTWFLTLYLTAVACEETLVLQRLLVFGIHLNEGTGNSEAKCLALTSETTTVEAA